jgi:hypothetical protein
MPSREESLRLKTGSDSVTLRPWDLDPLGYDL